MIAPMSAKPFRAHPGESRWTAPSRNAFTLVEVLVVITVIALLIGIIVPTVGFVRTKAQDAVCVANNGNIIPAWHAYAVDHGRFPSDAQSPDDLPGNTSRWATVNVYVGTTPQGNPRRLRPGLLNRYLGLDEKSRERTEVLHCPRDNGTTLSHSGMTLREEDGSAFEYLDDDRFTNSHFFLRGNSYWANDWLWCDIGAADGAGGPPDWRWNHKLRPETAIKSPSRTVTIGDAGSIDAGAMTQDALDAYEVLTGWWHGERQCTVGMWDGSAKRIAMTPGGYGEGYRLWLQPEEHPDDGTPVGKHYYVRFSTSAHGQTY